MNNFDFKTATYNVSGIAGFSLSEAMRFWKARFETPKHFTRAVVTHPILKELGTFVKDMWDSIEPITTQEAFQEKNIERRRAMFDCIGVVKLFQSMNPVLRDKQVLKKKRTRWNEKNEPWTHEFEDVYELYSIKTRDLFQGTETTRNIPEGDHVYAVRCWCTTTNREYWIYCPEDVATGTTRWEGKPAEYDAIRAIAWTIRIDITDPKRIFRQGDVIVAEESETSETVAPYHLTKEDYLLLVTSET